jgi:hypothetical protein
MVDPLSFALSNLRIIDEFRKLGKDENASMESDPGRAYNRIKKWKEERAQLIHGGAYQEEKKEGKAASLPCESPVVQAVRSLYSNPIRPGVVNVLYDEPGTGKSTAGIAILEDYYLLNGNHNIKGIMVSTQAADGLYVKLLADILETSKVDGWLNLFLWIMAEPAGSLPSLLILDDFNLDTNRDNLQFISHLYKRLNPPNRPTVNIIVVVITQDKHVANELCALNGGQRVRPMEGFYETKKDDDIVHNMLTFMKVRNKNHILTKPIWQAAKWTRELLVQMVEYHFTAAELTSIGDLHFVTESMTPYQAKAAVTAKLLESKAGMPISPGSREVPGPAFFPESQEDA